MSAKIHLSYLKESSLPVASTVHISTYPIINGGALLNKQPLEEAHSPKWQDCVHDVQDKGSGDNAYAVCTSSLGHQSEGGPGSGRKGGDSKKSGSWSKILKKVKSAFKKGKETPSIKHYYDHNQDIKDYYNYNSESLKKGGSISSSEGGPGSGRKPEGEVLQSGPYGAIVSTPKPNTILSYKYLGSRYKAGVRFPKKSSSHMHQADQSSSFPQNLRGEKK